MRAVKIFSWTILTENYSIVLPLAMERYLISKTRTKYPYLWAFQLGKRYGCIQMSTTEVGKLLPMRWNIRRHLSACASWILRTFLKWQFGNCFDLTVRRFALFGVPIHLIMFEFPLPANHKLTTNEYMLYLDMYGSVPNYFFFLEMCYLVKSFGTFIAQNVHGYNGFGEHNCYLEIRHKRFISSSFTAL